MGLISDLEAIGLGLTGIIAFKFRDGLAIAIAGQGRSQQFQFYLAAREII